MTDAVPDVSRAPLPECPHCRVGLPAAACNTVEPLPCPACGEIVQVWAFPACLRPPARGESGAPLELEGDAGCFYHPNRQAVLPCEGCGRFLCALCDVLLDGRHLCATCIESGRRKGRLHKLERHRILYDNVALALAVYPVILPFLWMFVIFTAPACLFVVLRFWKAPLSPVRRSRARLATAGGVAVVSLLVWLLVVAFLIWKSRSGT